MSTTKKSKCSRWSVLSCNDEDAGLSRRALPSKKAHKMPFKRKENQTDLNHPSSGCFASHPAITDSAFVTQLHFRIPAANLFSSSRASRNLPHSFDREMDCKWKWVEVCESAQRTPVWDPHNPNYNPVPFPSPPPTSNQTKKKECKKRCEKKKSKSTSPQNSKARVGHACRSKSSRHCTSPRSGSASSSFGMPYSTSAQEGWAYEQNFETWSVKSSQNGSGKKSERSGSGGGCSK